MGSDSVEKWARQIAEEMHAQGLYPWHVREQLKIRPIPPYLLSKMEKLVKMELEKLQKN